MSNNFLDKIKSSATEAGKKAQASLEITKIRSHIQSKEQEIERLFSSIGKLVFSAYENDNFADHENQIFSYCRDIASSKKDILALELKIKELRDEKECPSCSSTCSSHIKFCPNCGHKFQLEVAEPVEETEETKFCSGCGTSNNKAAKFCSGCGTSIT
ncbi:RNA polymerase subunit RPABC4/transcription elongation factor Spt4 [Bacillus fengqiuensis]|nr:RNA polymerase subunit RPABC4/transcription elongation factor Spt4 [Bacillus fengqiuensis]